MFHKVKCVKALDNYILEITFENNETKYYDIKPSLFCGNLLTIFCR